MSLKVDFEKGTIKEMVIMGDITEIVADITTVIYALYSKLKQGNIEAAEVFRQDFENVVRSGLIFENDIETALKEVVKKDVKAAMKHYKNNRTEMARDFFRGLKKTRESGVKIDDDLVQSFLEELMKDEDENSNAN